MAHLEKFGIVEAGKRLGRSASRMRLWEREGLLPAELVPPRDADGNRTYTVLLVELTRDWLQAHNMRSANNAQDLRKGSQ